MAVDFVVSAKQDLQLEQRCFSLQGEFPDDGDYNHRNMLQYGLIVSELYDY